MHFTRKVPLAVGVYRGGVLTKINSNFQFLVKLSINKFISVVVGTVGVARDVSS